MDLGLILDHIQGPLGVLVLFLAAAILALWHDNKDLRKQLARVNEGRLRDLQTFNEATAAASASHKTELGELIKSTTETTILLRELAAASRNRGG